LFIVESKQLEWKENSMFFTVFNRIIFCLVCLCIVGLLFINRKSSHADNYVGTIGVIQTASHPALDATRKGFTDAIHEKMGDAVVCIVRNGEGAISSLQAIAQQFHAKSEIEGIFAIATPAAQAVALLEDKKPLCIAAVSLSPSMQGVFAQQNICGVSDMIDIGAEIVAMKKLMPECKSVGVLYSFGEPNSVATFQLMCEELEKNGLQAVSVGINSEMDIEPAIAAAASKVDLFLAPTDNVIANAIALVIQITNKFDRPFVASDNMLVKYGALMARGVDFYQCGRQAGAIMIDVIVNGKKPSDIPIVVPKTQEIFVNKQVAEKYGIVVPESIMSDVIFV
jgi:putative ABC transport system substrate-binding protein